MKNMGKIRENTGFRAGIVLLAVLLFCVVSAKAEEVYFEKDVLSIQTKSGTVRLEIEMAETRKQRERGLMYRREIAESTGMLFYFKHLTAFRLWMKNTYIPLDMLFISKSGEIRQIERNTQPHSTEIIAAKEPVLAVLEIGGGEAKRLGIEVGDRVVHPMFQKRQ